MVKGYEPFVACGLYGLLALSFIVPTVKSLRRLRAGGVSRDTHNALVIDFAAAMIAGVFVVGLMAFDDMRGKVDDTHSYWVISGVVALLIAHTQSLRLLADERGTNETVQGRE